MSRSNSGPRCARRNSEGQQCNRAPQPGESVCCVMHECPVCNRPKSSVHRACCACLELEPGYQPASLASAAHGTAPSTPASTPGPAQGLRSPGPVFPGDAATVLLYTEEDTDDVAQSVKYTAVAEFASPKKSANRGSRQQDGHHACAICEAIKTSSKVRLTLGPLSQAARGCTNCMMSPCIALHQGLHQYVHMGREQLL
jgi:hypothetical protein